MSETGSGARPKICSLQARSLCALTDGIRLSGRANEKCVTAINIYGAFCFNEIIGEVNRGIPEQIITTVSAQDSTEDPDYE